MSRLMILCALAALTAPWCAAADTRFERFDHNGDGAITIDELPNKRAFKRLDRNRDGRITLAEARTALADGPAAESPTTETPGMVVTRDIAYATVPGTDAKDLNLDLYVPEGAVDRPVIVYVHGGAWAKGDKSRVGNKPAWCAGHGWVLASINYRLLPAGRHPVNVEDVARALAWLHANIRAHGGDPTRMVLMGHSAGAHLAALVATDDRRLAAHGLSPTMLSGVIVLDTKALDLPALMPSRFHQPIFGEDPAVWRDASPITHLSPQDPPLLCIHAEQKPEKEAMTTAFVQAAREAGVRAEIHAAPDRTHGSLNMLLGTADDHVTQRIEIFIASLWDQQAWQPTTGAGPGPNLRFDAAQLLTVGWYS